MDVQRLHDFADRIAADESLDRYADPLARVVRERLAGSPAGEWLSGRWLGHALHPALTDLPIGFWTSAMVADLAGRRSSRAADLLVALGVASALPTAAAGLVDWSSTEGRTRRIGLAHAALNTTAVAGYAASMVFRAKGKRVRGVATAFAAAGVATLSGFLGGRLAFEKEQPEVQRADAPTVDAAAPAAAERPPVRLRAS
jgi:uncharacterized membrane protein